MDSGLGKRTNEYARLVTVDAPKTVWVAIAVAFAHRLSDGVFGDVNALILHEWRMLYANGIVPQKPPAGE